MRKFILRRLVRISPLHFLVSATAEMGWQIAVENGDSEEMVQGLVVGTDDFIDRHTGGE